MKIDLCFVFVILFSSLFICTSISVAEQLYKTVPPPKRLPEKSTQIKSKTNLEIKNWVKSIKPAAGPNAKSSNTRNPYWLERTNRSRRIQQIKTLSE